MARNRLNLFFLLGLNLVACTNSEPGDTTEEESSEDPGPSGLAVLGGYTHSLDSVDLSVVATADDDLARPTDIAFNPRSPEQLWVLNQDAETVVLLENPGSSDQSQQRFRSAGGQHFLAQPAGIAFSDFGNFATIHDTDELTQGTNGTPEDFMGPSLWNDDLDVFDAGHGGHLDMLHNSPLGGGIAWESDNVYWVFDGYHESISRYDFGSDHGYGGTDHSDGEIRRYVEGEVARVEKVPSGLELDRETGLLYIADTANGRIAVLDTATGEEGDTIRPNYDGISQREVEGAEIWTLVDGAALEGVELAAPSGIALRDGVIYVSDNEMGYMLAFDMDGALLDWLDLGLEPGALGGIDLDASGALYITNMEQDEILRIRPADAQ